MLNIELPTLSREDISNLLKSRLQDKETTLRELPDPSSFKDMKRATNRILEAIKAKEKIAVVGDYDVDGVVATSVMRKFFDEIGYPIEWIIPNRFRDGYGVSKSVIERLNSPDLIITVDNGISANEAIEVCNSMGIDVIITDHHIVPKNPPNSYATVNQKQPSCTFPYEEICGAQVAWYLCASIKRALGVEVDMRSFLELVALAIVADIMPLLHINRAMLKSGLRLLESSNTPFVRAYREFTKKSHFRADDIAFGLAPLLNSAGRVDDARVACEYLCSKELNQASKLLAILNSFNKKRKEIEALTAQEAIALSDNSQKIIVTFSESWSEGVVGIVASRLTREFEKPSIVLTKKGDIYKGSGRSFGECNLFEAVNSQRGLLVGFGGHSKAIGLAVEERNISKFIDSLQIEAQKICPQTPYIDKSILGILPLKLVDEELFDLIDKFEPFGHANRRPKFISKNLKVVSMKLLGESGEHIKYIFKSGDVRVSGVHFRTNHYFEVGSVVDILYTIDENIFNGSRTIQLLIEKAWNNK